MTAAEKEQKYELIKRYRQNGLSALTDKEILEIYLSCVNIQKEPAKISSRLISRFGSLENVINANMHDLMKTDSLCESSCVSISLITDIQKKISRSENNSVKKLNCVAEAQKYCKNLIGDEFFEHFAMITLDRNRNIINSYIISVGSVNSANIDTRKIIESVIADDAECVILTHNHPDGFTRPSQADIDFTSGVKMILKQIGTELLDHIIVGKDSCGTMHDGNIEYKTLLK